MLGLSILIPVFNCDVVGLVHSLTQQAADWGGPVEVICLDDGSSEQYRLRNRDVADLPAVQYQELPHNVGRSAVRNRLAASARHEWLLLLDNDSALPNSRFLARYAAACTLAPVLVGGTVYESTAPASAELYLRWQYGRQREARPAAVRQQTPYNQLTLNNILIQAELFRRFGLDEQLTLYGHEDTKLGWQLHQANIRIKHLNNPVLHNGLEPAALFLQKSHEAVQNLVYLYHTERLGADTKLLQSALQLRRLGVANGLGSILKRTEPKLRQHLLGPRSQLWALDVLKLHWALDAMRLHKSLN